MARLWFCVLAALLSGFLMPGPALRAEAPLEAPPARTRATSAETDREPLVAPPARSAAAVTPELAALVEQLGHDSFVTREVASAKIAALGMPAKPALQAALKHADPEVRLRARRLMGQIQAADLEAAELRELLKYQGTWKRPWDGVTVIIEGERWTWILKDGKIDGTGKLKIVEVGKEKTKVDWIHLTGGRKGVIHKSIMHAPDEDTLQAWGTDVAYPAEFAVDAFKRVAR